MHFLKQSGYLSIINHVHLEIVTKNVDGCSKIRKNRLRNNYMRGTISITLIDDQIVKKQALIVQVYVNDYIKLDVRRLDEKQQIKGKVNENCAKYSCQINSTTLA